MSVSLSHNHKKRSSSRPKKRKKRTGVGLTHGKSMDTIKREVNRIKFGKKGS